MPLRQWTSAQAIEPIAAEHCDVLLIEDEPALRGAMHSHLHSLNIPVYATDDAEHALAQARAHNFSAIVLDVRLGRHDGFTVAHQLQEFTNAPILFISGASNAEIRTRAFEQGIASDFLVKPFAMAEFVARLRAILRRHRNATARTDTSVGREPPALYQIDDIELDTATLTLSRAGMAPQQISYGLYRLLVSFIKAPGHTLSKRELLTALTTESEPANDNSLKVSITRLRKLMQELGASDALIVHDRQRGYSLKAQVRTKVQG